MKKENLININLKSLFSKNIFFLITIFFISFKRSITRNCVKRDTLVKSLPNFTAKFDDFPCLYSGFINIDKTHNSNIFYVLISKIEEDPDSPLTIWLNGGPGSSSLLALFTEMGPFTIKKSNLNLNEGFSWSQYSNILLIDQPVGTGYSFTNHSDGIPKNQAEISTQLYDFLQKFFTEYSDLSKKPIFIFGENYSGKYIPEITEKIQAENIKIENGESLFLKKINLKKIAIGNGLFDTKYQRTSRKDLAKGLNLLSEYDDESQYDYLSQKCEFSLSNSVSDSYKSCDDILDFLMTISGDVYKYDVRKSSDVDDDLFYDMEKYLNLDSTAQSLFVYNTTIKERNKYFSYTNSSVMEVLKDDVYSSTSLPTLEKILNNYNIPVFLYAGQFDLVEGPKGIERAINSLNFTYKNEYMNSQRNLWKIKVGNNEYVIAGYIKQSKYLTFITIRNAGHYPFFTRPGSMLDFVRHVLSNETQWVCPDNKCSLVQGKCSFMNKCYGNGHCDESTAGKCKCKENFYGPECSLEVEALNNGNLKMLPKNVKLLHMDDYKSDILLEVDSDDKNLVVSLLDKKDHENLYDIGKHQIAYRMMNKKLILYLEKDKFENFLIVITNIEFKHEININVLIDHYSKYFFLF